MTVLTISREYGSEGQHIAAVVAQALGYHLVDRHTIENILAQYGFVEFYKEYAAAPNFLDRLDPRKTELIHMLDRTIRGVARHGQTVILGRGSFAVLRDLADVLNVRIQAPLALRVTRIMAQKGIFKREQAEFAVNESDRVRVAFLETFYGVRGDATGMFDIVIDTGKVAPDLAADWLIAAIQAQPEPVGEAISTTRSLEYDPVLAVAIAATLKCEKQH